MASKRRDWPWWRIKAGLEARGLSITSLAARHGITKWSLTKAKYRPQPRAQEILAAALGMAPQLVWPSRYHLTGSPVSPTVWMQINAAGVPGHRQKRRAA
jgi:Ner family transcriptional regulator